MTINCKGQLLDLTQPKVMGILNTTPDSFFDGGSYIAKEEILRRATDLLSQGADIIDIGGYSTRPGAAEITEAEESERVVPAIQWILEEFPDVIISVDTFRAEVAKASIEAGASIVNDISAGLLDEQMLPTVAELGVPYIMMHMKGNPGNMQEFCQYEDLVKEVIYYFSERVAKARELGISDIIIDPGFGFSKTVDQNYFLLHRMEALQMLELPILAGLSRKSMIYKVLENKAQDALNGTSVLNTIGLSKGANILRVHDVKEAAECIKLTQQLM